MALIRVPFPEDPQRRRDLFARAAAALARHGSYEGTPEAGTFRGSTPVGDFAGAYRYVEAQGELHIELQRKPWLVPTSMVEREVRRFLGQV